MTTVTLDDAHAIRKSMRAAQRRSRWRAFFLVAPLALFLLIIFVFPIANLLTRAVDNPEIVSTLPKTLHALQGWNPQSPPPDAAYLALADELVLTKNSSASGELARRLNYAIPGYRSLIFKTLRKLPLKAADAADAGTQMIAIDKRWASTDYWEAIASNSSSLTSYYLLASVDLKLDAQEHHRSPLRYTSALQDIFWRTFGISAGVTLITLLLGFPLAYWLTRLPKRKANLALICILIPFWTSVLVRIAAGSRRFNERA
ncbi:Putative spermidine/putrescine transport system permease protein OS=Castellaniella defragrans OX=75697 GN=HNR28_001142 PE=3 SV=1 [Castellaniella defragrans]